MAATTPAQRNSRKGHQPRPMTKDDICNVSDVPLDELLDALKIITTAAAVEQEALDRQARWTVESGKEVK